MAENEKKDLLSKDGLMKDSELDAVAGGGDEYGLAGVALNYGETIDGYAKPQPTGTLSDACITKVEGDSW